MNTYKNENVKCTFIIHKESETNAETLEKKVGEKIPDMELSKEFNLVYVYYLVDKKIQYPIFESDVLYIGKTNGQKHNQKKSAAFRFVHLREGQDYKQNITLRHFYEKGCVIGLDIIEVENCKDVEKSWRYEFLNTYGALPIADGASYSKEKGFINKSTDEAVDDLMDNK